MMLRRGNVDVCNAAEMPEASSQQRQQVSLFGGLACVRKPFNVCDSSSVAVIKSSITVGRVPKKLSVCYVCIAIV